MVQRADLHKILLDIAKSKNVYYQPPPSVSMSYPCIVYHLDDVQSKFADNRTYSLKNLYQITVIDRNPDSKLYEEILGLPLSNFQTAFSSEGLNHFVINLYF